MPLNLTGYHLTFDDEFNTFVSSPDGSQGWWTAYPWGTGWRVHNEQIGYFSDKSINADPFKLVSGTLQITASPGTNPAGLQYNTGMIESHNIFTQTHGYFEIRAKLPEGAGMLPQFWLAPANNQWPPEVDVMEALGAPDQWGGGGPNEYAVHTHSGPGDTAAGSWVTVPANIYTGYHTYGADWQPDYVTFYFDGQQVSRLPTPWDMTIPMYLIANLSVGGNWAGPTDGQTSSMNIDYIRAFSKNPNTPTVALQSISSPDGGGSTLWGATAGGTPQPPPPPPPPTVPPHMLSLILSGDALQGTGAKFTAKLDGQTVIGPTEVKAQHNAGKDQTFDVPGNWATGPHDIQIDFINDLRLSDLRDRNLYVENVRYDGKSFLDQEIALLTNGSASVTVS